jgi:hypothetical protein
MGTLKDLSVAMMVRLTEPWLDPKRNRPKLEALPSGKGLLPKLDAAYQGLLTTQKLDTTLANEIARIQERQAETDATHDSTLRGIYYVLMGLAELAATDEDAAALLAVRDELFPTGLSATQRSYSEEAGEVSLAQARISPKSAALLKKIAIPGGKLSNAVEAWFEAGRELGALEEERRKLEGAAPAKPGSGASRGDALRARNHWIKVVRHLETALDLDGASDETITEVLGPVRAAEKSAGRRGQPGRAPGSDGQVEVPAEPEQAPPA